MTQISKFPSASTQEFLNNVSSFFMGHSSLWRFKQNIALHKKNFLLRRFVFVSIEKKYWKIIKINKLLERALNYIEPICWLYIERTRNDFSLKWEWKKSENWENYFSLMKEIPRKIFDAFFFCKENFISRGISFQNENHFLPFLNVFLFTFQPRENFPAGLVLVWEAEKKLRKRISDASKGILLIDS